MEEFSTNLTGPEHERLSLLMEEMGESIQAIGKILRHGYESTDPTTLSDKTNRNHLAREVGHVVFAVKLMMASNDLSAEEIEQSLWNKMGSITPYLHHGQPIDQAWLKDL